MRLVSPIHSPPPQRGNPGPLLWRRWEVTGEKDAQTLPTGITLISGGATSPTLPTPQPGGAVRSSLAPSPGQQPLIPSMPERPWAMASSRADSMVISVVVDPANPWTWWRSASTSGERSEGDPAPSSTPPPYQKPDSTSASTPTMCIQEPKALPDPRATHQQGWGRAP